MAWTPSIVKPVTPSKPAWTPSVVPPVSTQTDEPDIESYFSDWKKEEPSGFGLLDALKFGWGKVKEAAASDVGQRFLHGDTPKDAEARRQDMLSTMSPEEKAKALALEQSHPGYKLGQQVGGPESEASIFPKWKSQPETYWGGFGKSLYEDILRPMGTPSAILGSAQPKGIPGPITEVLPTGTKLPNIKNVTPRGLPPAPTEIPPINITPDIAPTQAAAAKQQIAMPDIFAQQPAQQAGVVAGELGAVPTNKLMSGPLARGSAILESERATGIPQATTFSPAELAEQQRVAALRGSAGWGNTVSIGSPESALPPIAGETTGGFSTASRANLPYPENIAPEAVRPRTAQANILRTAGETAGPRQMPPNVDLGSITPAGRTTPFEKVGQALESPPGAPDFTQPIQPPPPTELLPPTRDVRSALEKQKAVSGLTEPPITPKPEARQFGGIKSPAEIRAQGQKVAEELAAEAKKAPTVSEAAKAISPVAEKAAGVTTNVNTSQDAKDAVKTWATGRKNGATFKGSLIKDKFKDLTDPDLIAKYEAGDRTGRLADVQKYFDDRFAEAEQLGLMDKDKKVLNYLRHEYNNTAEEFEKAVQGYASKTPSITKTRRFPTYEAAKEAGLTPKWDNMSDLMEAYEKKFQQAVKDKEFIDYLVQTKQVDPKSLGLAPANWKFQGANAGDLAKYVRNATQEAWEPLAVAAKVAGKTKNIYLAGGVPWTKYNMHAWNILQNDMKLNGYVSGLKKFFSDPTGAKAAKYLVEMPEADKEVMAKLVDRGWQFRPEMEAPLVKAEGTVGKIKEGAKWVEKKGEQVFEDPLFKRSLPALNAERTISTFKRFMMEGMPEEEALKAAAQIGNDFYGGANTAIRNPNGRDMARIGALAPNWMESQVTKAINQWKSAGDVAKSLVKGEAVSPVSKTYAKSLARSAGITGAGVVTGGALSAPGIRDIAAIPLGKDAKGKSRVFPTLTSANEEFRLLGSIGSAIAKKDPMAIVDTLGKNRVSVPVKTLINIFVTKKDDRGNPLAYTDKYGRPIGWTDAGKNYAKEALKPFEYQFIQGLFDYAKGDVSGEEAIARGAELPLSYTKPRKKGSLSVR